MVYYIIITHVSINKILQIQIFVLPSKECAEHNTVVELFIFIFLVGTDPS